MKVSQVLVFNEKVLVSHEGVTGISVQISSNHVCALSKQMIGMLSLC